jgi:hypothetical protein
MNLRVIGAGLPRTGTKSLRYALETLTGGPCYHGLETLNNPHHVAVWSRALAGDLPRWSDVLDGYAAAIDWPCSAFWRELTEAYPHAIVVLSVRRSADDWLRSFRRTIVPLSLGSGPATFESLVQFRRMFRDHREARHVWARIVDKDWWATSGQWQQVSHELLSSRLTADWTDESLLAAYHRHNDEVRESVPPQCLVEWSPEDGWDALAAAIGVPTPSIPFPQL